MTYVSEHKKLKQELPKLQKNNLFITFEGGEGAGKTTLIEEIFRYLTLHGYEVLKTREPGGTALGDKIRALVLESRNENIASLAELSLFLASRAQHVEEVILPALKAGKIVLCDRFNDSSVAYQGIARNLGKDAVSSACQFFSQNLEPTLTFYLDIDPSIGMLRVQRSREKDRIEQEDFSFHTLVRNAFLTIAKENPQRVFILDASLPKSQVQQIAIQKLCSIIL
ncbi:MAG TPA: dTMP kinase [Chlamydiales bacterium]|nr:dTMP kinase [Chlamydiales bacterium]